MLMVRFCVTYLTNLESLENLTDKDRITPVHEWPTEPVTPVTPVKTSYAAESRSGKPSDRYSTLVMFLIVKNVSSRFVLLAFRCKHCIDEIT